MVKYISAAAATIALLNTTSLQAAEVRKCIPAEAAESLITYALPGALGALRTKCGTSLPATAPLLQADSAQMQKYKTASAQAWPKAVPAIRSMVGQDFPENVEMDAFRPFIDAMVPAMLVQEVQTKDCLTIDKLYGLLEPMPAANLASLTVTLSQMGRDGEKENSNSRFNICKVSVE